MPRAMQPFFVDDEKLSDADFKRLYYDWTKLEKIDPKVQSARSAFNVGQWFGTAGAVKREDFDPWIKWTLPRQLRYPDDFMGGDQGVINYVVLQKEAFERLRSNAVPSCGGLAMAWRGWTSKASPMGPRHRSSCIGQA